MATIDIVRPRICHAPEADDWSLADQALEWCRAHKLNLDVEQEFMLRAMLGLDENGRWQAFEWALNAPRQNGKGEVLMARELFGLFELGEMSIVHSAHEFKTSAKHFLRVERKIRENPDLISRILLSPKGKHQMVGFKFSHGDESIELDNGAKMEFRTRSKTGMKGFDDVSLLVLDEAQILSEWAHGTMVPTLRASTARYGPQLLYAGNAADQEKDDNAIVWTRLRERGLEADDDFLVYFEYSLDYETPDEVPEDVARDPARWREVTWAMAHGRVTEAHMLREIRLLGWRQFITELLNVGDYPDTDLAAGSVISQEKWDDCEDQDSVIEGPVCLSIDVSGQRSSISVAGMNPYGRKHVEILHVREGTGWVPERIEELCLRHDVIEVACDGFGPANTIANKIEEQAGLRVRRLKTGEYADACGMFAYAVEEGDVVHIGQDQLTTAVKGARTRPLVDRFAWSRSKSRTDPGPLIAASIAFWCASEQDFGSVKVF